MKRNKFLRIAAVLMALALVTTLGVTSTLARYVATFEDQGGHVVRAGLFDVEATVGDVIAIGTPAGGWESTNGDVIIVPGLQIDVEVEIIIDNYSEVDVTIEFENFEIEVDAFAGAELEFSNDGGTTWVTDTSAWELADIAVTLPTAGFAALSTGSVIDLEFSIRWNSDGADETTGGLVDTDIGLAAGDFVRPAPAPTHEDVINLNFDLVALQVLPY